MNDYSEAEKIERAEHAKVLIADSLLNEALKEIGMDALVSLSKVDATDADGIRRLQAVVRVAEEFTSYIEAVVTASGAYNGGIPMQAEKK